MKRFKHRQYLPEDSTDIYYDTKLDKYLDRPNELQHVTYFDFYRQYYHVLDKEPVEEDEFVLDDPYMDDEEANLTELIRRSPTRKQAPTVQQAEDFMDIDEGQPSQHCILPSDCSSPMSNIYTKKLRCYVA